MVEQLDLSLVNWARAQFALTAMFHWVFVPLTLGLSFLLAFFETLYVKTGNKEWKRITRFWMTLFAINFAIGVATGIILEFQFGTNWSNYSWMVGDIFGAPLAAEGIFAFFKEHPGGLVFGLLSSAYVGFTGDEAAYTDARLQPMKLAAFEGLYEGERNAGLVAFGVPNLAKRPGDETDPFLFKVKVPGLLSLLANRRPDSFVPGIDDLVYGNEKEKIVGVREKIDQGKIAVAKLALYKKARAEGDETAAGTALKEFNRHQEFLGYGYLHAPEEAVPSFPIAFYSFHIMVSLGTLFPVLFFLYLFFTYRDTIAKQKWLLIPGLGVIFLGFIAGEAGWLVAEMGRQPWAIQGLLPVSVARSNLTPTIVQTTFFMFLILFTILFVAEIRIMLKQINKGPEGE